MAKSKKTEQGERRIALANAEKGRCLEKNVVIK